MTQQPPTPPMGERRRRREAERKAAQATGELELNEPMTRRERRALEEALASGALELTPDGQYAPTGEVPVAIVTAFLGAPMLIWAVRRYGAGSL